MGWNETVIFYNQDEQFNYAKPDQLIDSKSGVICIPENYQNPENDHLNESRLRITNPANFDLWDSLEEDNYKEEKKDLNQSC